jgi:putative DNA primase/helicase
MTDDTHHYCDDALKAAGIKPSDRDENLIRELAQMSELAYQRRRQEAAERLNINLKALDKIIVLCRAELQAKHTPMLYPHWTVQPAEDPVHSSHLLPLVMQRVRRHVIMTSDQALAVTLWIMFTWIHDAAAVHSPMLLVTSSEPDSGKSTLLGLIGFLARRTLLSVSITGPALFRSIEKWQPTFAIDEADEIFINNDDLREVVNSGWTRGQGVPRCDPETNEPRLYPTFCPKAIGMKGKHLRDTTLGRCIRIELQRKLPTETVEDFDHIDDAELADLRSRLARWADDHAAALKKATPEIPPGFHNRIRANWKLLFAIAETAGKDRKAEAWRAAEAIEGVRTTSELSMGVRLLAAVRPLFGPDAEQELHCMLTNEIIRRLTEDPEQPWVEYRRGKPITPRQLSDLLKPYKISSGTVHPSPDVHGWGYKRQQFEDAWRRYLDGGTGFRGSDPCIRANVDAAGTSTAFSSVREDHSARIENANLFNNHAGSHGCTDEKPLEPAPRPLCAQCRGEEGASPALHSGPGYPPEGVWLHRECARFWSLKAPAAPRAKVESTPASAGTGNGDGDPWADLDIPAYLNRQ